MKFVNMATTKNSLTVSFKVLVIDNASSSTSRDDEEHLAFTQVKDQGLNIIGKKLYHSSLWKYISPDINNCQKNRDIENLRFLMKSVYIVRHILQRHRAELVLLLVLSHFGSVDLSAVRKCPLGQVDHAINRTSHEYFCCVPVHLPKGYEFKSCTENGKNDTIEVCPTEPVQEYQWDDTTTESEAFCSPEMQCESEDFMKDEICDESGQNCRTKCVCNFRGGYCGTEYYNCVLFPPGCPKDDIQKDCSCRRSIQLPGSESTTSMNPDRASKLPSTSDKKIEGDQMPDGVVMKEENKSNQNKNATVSEAGEESLSSASGNHITIISVAVFTVVVTVVCILVCVFCKTPCKKLLRKKCNKRSTNHDAEQQKPVGKVKPFLKNPLQDQDVEAQSLQRHVNGQDEPAGHEVETQTFLPGVNGQGEPAGHEVETQSFLPGESQMNMSLNCTSMGSSLFHSLDNIVDQVVSDDSERHQTDAKVVVSSENLSGNDVQL